MREGTNTILLPFAMTTSLTPLALIKWVKCSYLQTTYMLNYTNKIEYKHSHRGDREREEGERSRIQWQSQWNKMLNCLACGSLNIQH